MTAVTPSVGNSCGGGGHLTKGTHNVARLVMSISRDSARLPYRNSSVIVPDMGHVPYGPDITYVPQNVLLVRNSFVVLVTLCGQLAMTRLTHHDTVTYFTHAFSRVSFAF